MSLDQAFPQPAADTKPGLESGHLACIAVVIIAKKVQQSVQCQNAELGLETVSRTARLAPSHAHRNHDISNVPSIFARERQHVRYMVFAPVPPVERANLRIRHENHCDGTPRARGSDRRKPSGQSGSARPSAGDNLDSQPRPAGSLRHQSVSRSKTPRTP